MRYKVKGLEIRSENAAKPASQASKSLLCWIKNHKKVTSALDYGCGKLRYSHALAERSHKLTLVDSKIQLTRTQLIDGNYTTIYKYAYSNFKNVRILTVEEFINDKQKYDLVLCANVLSTIPVPQIRSKIIENLRNSLKLNGVCLLVTQFRNSYFKHVQKMPNVISHLDGWILKSKKGNFYYGILTKRKLESLLKRHGFKILNSWVYGQSAYA